MSQKRPFLFPDVIHADGTDGVTTDYEQLPLLITKDLVLFPDVMFPIMLTRPMAVKVAKMAHSKRMALGVVCQTDPEIENPGVNMNEICRYGVVGVIFDIIDLPDGTQTALVSAGERIEILSPVQKNPFKDIPTAVTRPLPALMTRGVDREMVAIANGIKEVTKKMIHQRPNREEEPSTMSFDVDQIEDPGVVINITATYAPFSVDFKQKLLAEDDIKRRGLLLLSELTRSDSMSEIMNEITQRTKERIGQEQRQAFLHQQMQTIREELFGDELEDIRNLRMKAEKMQWPQSVADVFKRDLERLSRLNTQSPDYALQFAYLETILALPWNTVSPLTKNIAEAEEILEADHYGLEKVKERILEQLAVMLNTPDGRSPILCLVGAPGVGKTSLGKSIAAALDRKYVRISLGGMHDEAEIRGHRRTYIGAMPGRIIDALKRAGTSNPLILLDEIDKLGKDFRGDPSAALLEVLDPEQNHRFHDNYVDIDFDLSKVLFVATANTLSDIPRPLADRMEIIEIPGYLPEEKVEIARRHLIPRALKANNLDSRNISYDPEALEYIIDRYTSESGVRGLEKEVQRIVRKLILDKMRGKKRPRRVDVRTVKELLGVERFSSERYDVSGLPGVATGLAWTAAGGDILFIETSLAPAKNDKLTLTGNLGDVMKESAMIALQYVRAHAESFGIDRELLDTRAVHLHVPEGAIPKDGPSAGITMAMSIISAFTGKPLKPRIAMTGELTLRGKVLPVGGIKEKVLAAKRAGITEIILPEDNRRDLTDIKPSYLEGITFRHASTIDQVLAIAIG